VRHLPLLAWLCLPGVLLLMVLFTAPRAEAVPAAGQSLGEPLAAQVQQMILAKLTATDTPNVPAQGKATKTGAVRIEVTLGQLDPRLQLSPCAKIEPYVPAGSRLWGAARIGLRCLEGARAWNVYLPVTVAHFGPGLVAVASLPAGHTLVAADLRTAEVNLTEQSSPAVDALMPVAGRTLSLPLGAGQNLRQSGLKARQWFAAGDPVQLRVTGGGFAIQGSGEALTPGMEGQMARVRTEAGKIVSGMPVGERQLEIAL
jgi:flagella basal body P-ring formation protein FlgA